MGIAHENTLLNTANCSIIAYNIHKGLIHLETKAITVRVDQTVKEQAERMLDDMGINMTTYIVSCLKALIREKKIPFELVTTQYLADKLIIEKLIEAEKEASDPNTIWLNHEEVFSKIREKYGYDEI